ncbi:MAG: helix-turn-helix domain-containing protein, partial [Methanobacterium sp.]
MLSFDEILLRLKYIESVNTDNQLSEKLGINAATISMWRKRKSIPSSFLINYCLNKNISIDWLLTGKTLEKSLRISSNNISMIYEPNIEYGDPRDKIIQRLEDENRQLKKLLDDISILINKSH